MPFRSHALTTFLKDCFTNTRHRTVVLATVSPCPSDTEHTRRTLELVAAMRGTVDEVTRCTRVGSGSTEDERRQTMPFIKWPATQVSEWQRTFNATLVSGAAGKNEGTKEAEDGGQDKENSTSQEEAAGGRAAPCLRLPKGTDGKILLRMTVLRLRQYCGNDPIVAKLAYDEVRAESKRQSVQGAEKRQRVIDLYHGVQHSPASKATSSSSSEVGTPDKQQLL